MPPRSVLPPIYTPVSQMPVSNGNANSPQRPVHGSSSQSAAAPTSTALQVPMYQRNENPYLVPLSFNLTLGRSVMILVDHFKTLLPIALTVLIPLMLLWITITAWIVNTVMHVEYDYNYEPKHLHFMFAMVTLQLMLYATVTIWGRGALIRAVSEIHVHGYCVSDWRDCLGHVTESGQLKPLLMVSAIISVGMVLAGIIPYGLLLLSAATHSPIFAALATWMCIFYTAGALYYYSLFIMASPAICVEGLTDPYEALARSRQLVSGSHCYVFLGLLVMFTVHHLVTNALQLLLLESTGGGVAGSTTILLLSVQGMFVTLAPMLVFFPLHAVLETVMYLNVRVQRESLNHDVLAQEVARSSPFKGSPQATVGTVLDYRPLSNVEEGESEMVWTPPTITSQPLFS